MKWWNIIKSPYMDWQRTDDPYRTGDEVTRTGQIRPDTKVKGTASNPLVIITNPTPIKGEKWDNTYQKFYHGDYGTSEGTTITVKDGTEISSYGRVKKGGSIVVPENTKYGFGTFIKGEKQHYKQNRYKSKYGGKMRTYRSAGGFVPYGITVQLMLDLKETIDPDAELFVSGNSIGKFADFKPQEYTGSPHLRQVATSGFNYRQLSDPKRRN